MAKPKLDDATLAHVQRHCEKCAADHRRWLETSLAERDVIDCVGHDRSAHGYEYMAAQVRRWREDLRRDARPPARRKRVKKLT